MQRTYTRRFVTGALLAAAASAATAQTGTQGFPNKPFRFVVPFAAGSTTDNVARHVARHLTEATGQPVVVENKAGANGILGIQHALSLPADGYTVLITTNTTQAANPHLFKKLPYDPLADFVPLTSIITGGMFMVVNPNSPLKSVQDVVAAAKKQPGKLSFGSGNSTSRIGGEMMNQLAGINLLHVPYKGIPMAITDLMGGQIDLMVSDGVSVLPHVKSGKLRALGVSTRTRTPGLESIPTIMEQGVANYDLSGWVAAYAPKGTPPELADRLNALLVPIVRLPETAKVFGESGWVPTPRTRKEFTDFNAVEVERWGRMIRAAKIEPE